MPSRTDVALERGDNLVEVVLRTKKKVDKKNMYHRNKVNPANLFGKTCTELSAVVDAKIKADPSLSTERMKLLNAERSKLWKTLSEDERGRWVAEAMKQTEQPQDFGSSTDKYKLAKEKITQLSNDTSEAFNFPIVSVLFQPPDGLSRAKATIFDCEAAANGKPGFTSWLIRQKGQKALAVFLRHVNEYASSLFKEDEGRISSDITSESRNNSEKSSPDAGKIWKNGIQMLPDPRGLGAIPLRRLYRQAISERWKASGYPTKNVQWRRIEAAPQDFVQPDALPEGMGIMEADKYSKGNLEKLLIFFRRHQAGEVPWEKGLVFIPYGDRTELHYQRRSNNSNSVIAGVSDNPSISNNSDTNLDSICANNEAPLIPTTAATIGSIVHKTPPDLNYTDPRTSFYPITNKTVSNGSPSTEIYAHGAPGMSAAHVGSSLVSKAKPFGLDNVTNTTHIKLEDTNTVPLAASTDNSNDANCSKGPKAVSTNSVPQNATTSRVTHASRNETAPSIGINNDTAMTTPVHSSGTPVNDAVIDKPGFKRVPRNKEAFRHKKERPLKRTAADASLEGQPTCQSSKRMRA